MRSILLHVYPSKSLKSYCGLDVNLELNDEDFVDEYQLFGRWYREWLRTSELCPQCEEHLEYPEDFILQYLGEL